MAVERQGTLVGVWLEDDEIEKLNGLAERLHLARLSPRQNRSEALRALVRVFDEDEVVTRLVMEVVSANTQEEAQNGEVAVLAN